MKAEANEFVDRMMYVFSAPFIVWPGYEETVTVEQRDKSKMERLILLASAKELYECTDYEAAIYLSSASLIAPLSHTYVKIYTYVFLKAFPNSREMLDAEAQTLTLYPNEEYELHRLKQWIFKQQMQAIKEKTKQTKQVPQPPKVATAQYQQLLLE